MRRTRFVLVAGVAALAIGVALAGAAVPVKVSGTVGPGFTIGLKTSTGKLVLKTTTLKAGSYSFTVKDASSIHNFTLNGPGVVNKVITATSFTGTKTVTVLLKKGTYRFYCSIHPTIMTKTFKVG